VNATTQLAYVLPVPATVPALLLWLSISEPIISFAGNSLVIRSRSSLAGISATGTGLRFITPCPMSSFRTGFRSSECSWAFSPWRCGSVSAAWWWRFSFLRRRRKKARSPTIARKPTTAPTVAPAMTPAPGPGLGLGGAGLVVGKIGFAGSAVR
jgi:hypothetical protein